MPECSICRRSYDERFQVFIPPHPESFDRIECARRAARIWGVDTAAAVPVLLPTIAAVGAGALLRRPAAAAVPLVAPRRAVAALAALAIAPGQVALTAGVGLFAAGSAASVYLAARPAGKPHLAAATDRPAGRKVGMAPAAQSDAPVSVASSGATELLSDAANRPAHVALHSTALLAAAPRVHADLSSGEASTQLASRQITVQSLAPAEPFLPPTPPDSGPSSTSTSPKPSATGTNGQNTKTEPTPSPHRQPKPTPGTVEPAAPATPPIVPEEPVAATSASVSDTATVVESRTPQGSDQSGKQKPPSSVPPPPPPTTPPPTTPPPTTPPPTTPPPTTTPAPTSTPPPPSSVPPPSASPPPSSTPPVTTPQQQPSGGDTRPGNGNGDPNHVHTGPPGNSGNGNGHHH